VRDDRGSGRSMWNLYREGGVAPALASLIGNKRAEQMAWLRRLMKEQRRQAETDVPIDELEAVVFDLETTGFNPTGGDAIISVGAVAVKGTEVLERETFYSLANPKRPVPPDVERLTGITTDEALAAPDLIDVLGRFFAFVGRRVLIAHGAGHDKRFLREALWKTSRAQLSHRVLDTMMVAKWLHPDLHGHDLDTLLGLYGIPAENRHHALADSRMTARLWAGMAGRMRERRVYTLGDLYMYLSRG